MARKQSSPASRTLEVSQSVRPERWSYLSSKGACKQYTHILYTVSKSYSMSSKSSQVSCQDNFPPSHIYFPPVLLPSRVSLVLRVTAHS